MASQYLTFMMVFMLGLSLVVATNGMFSTLSESFQNELADIEAKTILTFIKNKIYSAMTLESLINRTISTKIDLPSLLGERYYYEVNLSIRGDNLVLNCRNAKLTVNESVVFKINPQYNVTQVNGLFDSRYPVHIMKILIDSNKNVKIYFLDETMIS